MDEIDIAAQRPLEDESIPEDWRDDGVVYVVRRSELEAEPNEVLKPKDIW